MNRPSPILWLALFIILLLPTAAGRVFLDLAGGLLILFFALPILIGGAGWIGWNIIKARMNTCSACGTSFFSEISQCPICGAEMNKSNNKNNLDSIPASSATIDVNAEEAE